MQMVTLQVSLLPQNFVYSVFVCKFPYLLSEKCEIIRMDVAVMHATTLAKEDKHTHWTRNWQILIQ